MLTGSLISSTFNSLHHHNPFLVHGHDLWKPFVMPWIEPTRDAVLPCPHTAKQSTRLSHTVCVIGLEEFNQQRRQVMMHVS